MVCSDVTDYISALIANLGVKIILFGFCEFLLVIVFTIRVALLFGLWCFAC